MFCRYFKPNTYIYVLFNGFTLNVGELFIESAIHCRWIKLWKLRVIVCTNDRCECLFVCVSCACHTRTFKCQQKHVCLVGPWCDQHFKLLPYHVINKSLALVTTYDTCEKMVLISYTDSVGRDQSVLQHSLK